MRMPLFPLKLVPFPGELLNLHIFEARYKQLVHEAVDLERAFGIVVFDGEDSEIRLGTEMRVLEIVKKHAGGEMDIKTLGLRAIEVSDFEKQASGRLYPDGEVRFLENVMDGDNGKKLKIDALMKKLYELIRVRKSFDDLSVFSIAHHIGMSLEQERDLLQITHESERQDVVIAHLEQLIPSVLETERLKERIRMNGHFKNLPPLKF